MHLREALLQPGTQIQKILKGQVGMQSADDVKFCDRLGVSGGSGFECLFEGHGIGARSVFLPAEGTQAARRYADVRWINVPVDVEICLIAVHAFAHGVRHPAHGENIARAIQGESILGVKALADKDLFVNRRQPWIIGLKGVRLERLRLKGLV